MKQHHGAPLNTPEGALSFIFAGAAFFALRSNKSHVDFLYKVKANAPRTGQKPGYFVSVVDQITRQSKYLGLYVDELRRTEKSQFQIDSPEFIAFSWTIRKLKKGQIPEGLEIRHMGDCGSCGKPLLDEKSILRGFGPYCWKLLHG